jgi:hypothetical protein
MRLFYRNLSDLLVTTASSLFNARYDDDENFVAVTAGATE